MAIDPNLVFNVLLGLLIYEALCFVFMQAFDELGFRYRVYQLRRDGLL